MAPKNSQDAPKTPNLSRRPSEIALLVGHHYRRHRHHHNFRHIPRRLQEHSRAPPGSARTLRGVRAVAPRHACSGPIGLGLPCRSTMPSYRFLGNQLGKAASFNSQHSCLCLVLHAYYRISLHMWLYVVVYVGAYSYLYLYLYNYLSDVDGLAELLLSRPSCPRVPTPRPASLCCPWRLNNLHGCNPPSLL